MLAVIIVCFMVLANIQINAEKEKESFTRAELADAAMEIYEYVTQEFSMPIAECPLFYDISQSPFAYRIEQAYLSGFVNGVGNGIFLPDEKVTRLQATVVLYRVVQRVNDRFNLPQELKENQVYICDLESIPDWAKEGVVYMVSCGLITLDGDAFLPNNLISNSEFDNAVDKIKELFVPYPFELNGLWGYKESSGKVIVAPEYYGAEKYRSTTGDCR